MSLLTALLAFVPALIAKPERAEDETARQLIALKIGLTEAQDELAQAWAERDMWQRRATRVIELIDENARLRHELDMLRALYTGQQQGHQLAQQNIPYRPPSQAQMAAHAYMQQVQGLQNQQALGMQNQYVNQQWLSCTCVPGRADMFRMDRDGA